MAAKFHIDPKPLNDSFSAGFFDHLLEILDNDRSYLTAEDIAQLQPYRLQLDDELKLQKTTFLSLLINLYQKRLQQVDTMIDNISKKPFDFNIAEKLTVTEDTSWPANAIALRNKLYKKMKLEVLSDLEDEVMPGNIASQKKHLDSAQAIFQKKIQGLYKRDILKLLQSPGGIVQVVGNVYCKALANCYDPHTEYFPLSEKENFDSELGKQPFRFGFHIKSDKSGGAIIKDLEPGSPAYKCGLLNEGDKFMDLKWGTKQPIDVSDAGVDELSRLLDENNHDTVAITVKKADGTLRKVSLMKEMAEESDEEDKVKSFLLKGSQTIGYISLPAFYSDWEDESAGVNGCANDVAKEIIKLKKENISGLIIDLRYNGGGSLKEAVELSGIFIDAGPVEQIKSSDPKIITLKDINRGTIYDGPLVILVNGYTASASEMVAGTLQDYNRALIVGSTTYGKATGQVILPLDTTINLEKASSVEHADSYLKVTLSKLYRINGTSAQAVGVKPDVLVPDVLEIEPHREADEKFVLQLPKIDANKYYKPYPPLQLASLIALAKQETDTAAYFKELKTYIQEAKTSGAAKDESLKLSDIVTKINGNDMDTVTLPELRLRIKPQYSIVNNIYEQQRLAGNKTLAEMDSALMLYLSHDAYVKLSYDLLLNMSK